MAERKSTAVLIKLSPAEKRELNAAARREHLPTTTWLRALGLHAARAANEKGHTMKTILAIAILGLAAACGGTQVDGAAPAEQATTTAPGTQTTQPAATAPAAAVSFDGTWTFTAQDVAGSFTITGAPPPGPLGAPDSLTLTGTGSANGVSGAALGNGVPSNGIFRVYLALPNSRVVRMDVKIDATGRAFSGYLLDTANAPNGIAKNEQVTGALN